VIETSRRGFITGLISLVAAPAIVRVASIMPVKAMADFDPFPFPPGAYWASPQDIAAVVRRAFVPRFYVDLCKDVPLLAAIEKEIGALR